MKITKIRSLSLSELKVIEFARFNDERGYFTETYRASVFDDNLEMSFISGKQFKQINESFTHKDFFRGLHFQWKPYMDKLIRCVQGHIIDFAMDIRPDSPHFGKIIAHPLKSNNRNSESEWLWVPNGFAHGFYAVEDSTIEYMCTAQWSQGNEATLLISDDEIDWTLCENDIIGFMSKLIRDDKLKMSNKDRMGIGLTKWKTKREAQLFQYEA